MKLSLPFWWEGSRVASEPLGARAVGGRGSRPGGSWLCRPRSLPGKPTGYCTAFVCLVTQLLVIEKFHRSGAGQAR